MKNLDAPYKPGSRVGYGIKIKPIKETLDLAISGAEWGKGRRSNWLSSFTLACSDDGEMLDIGKLGTGLSDAQFKEVTDKLLKYFLKLCKYLVLELITFKKISEKNPTKKFTIIKSVVFIINYNIN